MPQPRAPRKVIHTSLATVIHSVYRGHVLRARHASQIWRHRKSVPQGSGQANSPRATRSLAYFFVPQIGLNIGRRSIYGSISTLFHLRIRDLCLKDSWGPTFVDCTEFLRQVTGDQLYYMRTFSKMAVNIILQNKNPPRVTAKKGTKGIGDNKTALHVV